MCVSFRSNSLNKSIPYGNKELCLNLLFVVKNFVTVIDLHTVGITNYLICYIVMTPSLIVRPTISAPKIGRRKQHYGIVSFFQFSLKFSKLFQSNPIH